MLVLYALLMVVIPAAAQNPLVRLVNTSHPASRVFQVGDRFEVLLTGAPNQPVSVRTTMNGRIDWGPIIGATDSTGRWSTAGQFEKSDFGSWYEVWTIGGKLANPAVQFSVSAPCLPGGQGFMATSGPNMMLTCETAEGRQIFSSPSASDSFRTSDGRRNPGALNRKRNTGRVPDKNPSRELIDLSSPPLSGQPLSSPREAAVEMKRPS